MQRRVTVLLVDDDDTDLIIAARRLRTSAPDRYRLLQASNLEEAVATLRVSPVEAVVLDLNLGGSSGPETVAALRREARQTLIVAITGHSTPQLERACLDAGADQFLDKEAVATGEALMHALEFELRRDRSATTSLAAQVKTLLERARPQPTSTTTDGVEAIYASGSERLRAAAHELATQRQSPREIFAQLLADADDSEEPSLVLAALAVYLAQEYFDALDRTP